MTAATALNHATFEVATSTGMVLVHELTLKRSAAAARPLARLVAAVRKTFLQAIEAARADTAADVADDAEGEDQTVPIEEILAGLLESNAADVAAVIAACTDLSVADIEDRGLGDVYSLGKAVIVCNSDFFSQAVSST